MGFRDLIHAVKSLVPATSLANVGGGWTSLLVNEPAMGAWQKNQELTRTGLLGFHAVFSCVSLISSDIGKLRVVPKKLEHGVWIATPSRADTLLKKPNNLQTWQQFIENWITSKLTRGNSYIFKQRDMYGNITQLFVLNPDRVKPLISDEGEVFYQISRDKLFDMAVDMVLPASEVIHDRFNCFYHPLIGLSPITACAVSAEHGIAIQNNATILFQNASRPSGILTTPGPLDQAKANEIKSGWQKNYSGLSQGGIAVLGDGVSYQTISLSANDTQMIDQLKMTSDLICSVFHVPVFKIGFSSLPSGQNVKVGDLNEIYFSDCIQHFIECVENLLDIHLELEDGIECWIDTKSLIRMDSASQMDYLQKGTHSGIISPNEARAEIGLPAVVGGESPLMQQQNFSLQALAKRDAWDDPFAKATVGIKADSDILDDAVNPPEKSVKQDKKAHETHDAHDKNNTPTAEKTAQNTPATPSDNPNQSTNTAQNPQNATNSSEKPAFDDLYKGIFSAENTYAKGDFVTKKGGLWVAKCSNTGDFDYQNWQLVSKNGGEQGEKP